jgi:hypothetical protein
VAKPEQIHKKQINEKKDELVRMIRLYLIGVTDAKMVRNTLQCLFTDIFIDKTTYETEEQLNLGHNRGNFERFMKEMMR